MHRSVLIKLCFVAAGVAGALPPLAAQVPPDEPTSITALFSTHMFFRLGVALGLNSSTDSPIYLRLGTAF